VAKNGQKTVLSSQISRYEFYTMTKVWGHKHPAFVPTPVGKESSS